MKITTEEDITSEIYNLSQAYAVLSEVDAEMLGTESGKFKKAKRRLLTELVNKIESLSPEKKED